MANGLTNGEHRTLVSNADHLALERLVTEAAWRVDEGMSDRLAELFVGDGEFVLGETVHRGRAAIREWGRRLDEARTYKRIRHVAGNMRFVAAGEDSAEGVTVLTGFMDDETGSSTLRVIGEDHDRFVRTDDGWRFASRRWEQLLARTVTAPSVSPAAPLVAPGSSGL